MYKNECLIKWKLIKKHLGYYVSFLLFSAFWIRKYMISKFNKIKKEVNSFMEYEILKKFINKYVNNKNSSKINIYSKNKYIKV